MRQKVLETDLVSLGIAWIKTKLTLEAIKPVKNGKNI